MPFQNLPWLPSSDQFLHAILAGAQSRKPFQRPRFSIGGGGGGGRPTPPTPPPETPTDPHLSLAGSILSYVDPNDSRFQTPDAAPKPFEALGQRFITNPTTGNAEPYSPPRRIEKVGGDLVEITQDQQPSSPFGTATVPEIGVRKLYDGGSSGGHISVNSIDTRGMTPDQARLAQYLPGSPRVSGSPYEVSNYLHSADSPFPVPVNEASPLPASKDALEAGTVYKTARGNARWDGDSFEPVP